MQRVLVPIDGSDTSFRALDFGLELAERFGATVDVVHFSNEETDATATIVERAREAVEGYALADTPEVELIDLEIWSDSGVGRAIVAFARDEGYDHVVMGHHGSGAVQRAILGSAAETVVRAESVPVTIVP
jgi:nucleotide-binding universal stress UspA family protein